MSKLLMTQDIKAMVIHMKNIDDSISNNDDIKIIDESMSKTMAIQHIKIIDDTPYQKRW
jgi:hypothetical protein